MLGNLKKNQNKIIKQIIDENDYFISKIIFNMGSFISILKQKKV